MFEILKNLLAGTPLEGLLKLFGGLFGESENVDNQQNTNGDSSSSQENPFPSNDPNSEGSTTSNEDFNLDEILKQVEDIFGGGTNSNAATEPENGEIEPPFEPEMQPDEPEIEPEQPNGEPIPTNSPEPISAPEPEAQPMPSAEELKEASNNLGKDADNLVVEDESLGFEPETEADKGLDMNSKPTNEDESLGFEPESESDKSLASHSKPIPDSESLGFEKE